MIPNTYRNRPLSVESLDQRAVPALLGGGLGLVAAVDVAAVVQVGDELAVGADIEATVVVVADIDAALEDLFGDD